MVILGAMRKLALFILMLIWPMQGLTQSSAIKVATVTRPPFSMSEGGRETGFSLELWHTIAQELNLDYEIVRYDNFSRMLAAVETRNVDLAVANISIKASREQVLDFSQPIFDSGLQVMVPVKSSGTSSLFKAILSVDLLLAVLLAFAMLFGGGMLMWRLERQAQPYFDRPMKEAMFPSFWWALNLVVNGGFEERVPRTIFGRMFAVLLVISSLFIVSVFVARITSVMTVDAITHNVHSTNDLYGKSVGTIQGSTAADFLGARDIAYSGFEDLHGLLAAFEGEQLEAVVFDAPILAYYVLNDGAGIGELAGSVFLRESYGIALPSDSDMREMINLEILALRENGTYKTLHDSWFGSMQ